MTKPIALSLLGLLACDRLLALEPEPSDPRDPVASARDASDEPTEETPAHDAAPNDEPDAAVLDQDASCLAACASRACGPDPVCGAACGTCPAHESCITTDAGASCEPSTLQIEVNGTPLVTTATHEVFRSAGAISVFFPHYGRLMHLSWPEGAAAGQYRCDPASPLPTGISWGAHTGETAWADLSAVPQMWRDLYFSQCGNATPGGEVSSFTLKLSHNGPNRVAGSYEVIVLGNGPREGTTLRLIGSFDLTPPP